MKRGNLKTELQLTEPERGSRIKIFFTSDAMKISDVFS
jgi:hypothetical protein